MALKPGKEPDAFLSYTRSDDAYTGGQITLFREYLERAVCALTGRPFVIFQDVDGIGLGEHWPDKLDLTLDQVRFFMPMVTPSFFASEPCRTELSRFLQAEQRAGRNDLILPIYCIEAEMLEDEMLRSRDQLAAIIYERQRHDWRDLLLEPFDTREVRRSLQALAREIRDASRRLLQDQLLISSEQPARETDAARTSHAICSPVTSPPGKLYRDIDEPWCPEMVVIPPGHFVMGSPEDEVEREASEGPEREIRIEKIFALGRFPITRGEFAIFAGDTGHRGEGVRTLRNDLWKLDRKADWRLPGIDQNDRHPVVGISRNDALAYLAWLSHKTGKRYELPSEAIWEYASRAGTTTPFWTGRTISTYQANFDGTVHYGGVRTGVWRRETTVVDKFAANPFGLFEMHGNVWEWCADRWHGTYDDAPQDATVWLAGSSSHGVVRGGSWINGPKLLRSAARFPIIAGFRYYNVGFRCARFLD